MTIISSLKLLISKVLYVLISSVYFIKCILDTLKIPSLWKFVKEDIYNNWMCLQFNCNNCKFRYPVNICIGKDRFQIGQNSRFGKDVVLTAWKQFNGMEYNPEVIIGEYCSFGDYLHLSCIDQIVIGKNVLTGRWVTIVDNLHGNTNIENLNIPPAERLLFSKGKISIGDNVWIGDKVTILSGVSIGEGAVVGANTVVTKSIPPFSIAIGSPMRVL